MLAPSVKVVKMYVLVVIGPVVSNTLVVPPITVVVTISPVVVTTFVAVLVVYKVFGLCVQTNRVLVRVKSCVVVSSDVTTPVLVVTTVEPDSTVVIADETVDKMVLVCTDDSVNVVGPPFGHSMRVVVAVGTTTSVMDVIVVKPVVM